MDVVFSTTLLDPVVALYLPRRAGSDPSSTAKPNSTFLPSAFPSETTACALLDVGSHYNVTLAFAVAYSSGASCVRPFACPVALIATESVSARFGCDLLSKPVRVGVGASKTTANWTISYE